MGKGVFPAPPRPATKPCTSGLVNLKELGSKHFSFIDYVVLGMDPGEAAEKVGYAPRSARKMGEQLLRNALVRSEIELRKAQRATIAEQEAQEALREAGVNGARTVLEAARIAFVDIRKAFDEHNNLLNIKDLPDDLAAAIASIEVEERMRGSGDNATPYFVKKVKFHPKMAAINTLMEHLGIAQPKPDDPKKKGNTAGALHIHLHDGVQALPDQMRIGGLTIDMEPAA